MIKLVQANVELEEYQDKVINAVKAKYGIRNKPDAINFIIKKYGEITLKGFFDEEVEKESEKQVNSK